MIGGPQDDPEVMVETPMKEMSTTEGPPCCPCDSHRSTVKLMEREVIVDFRDGFSCLPESCKTRRRATVQYKDLIVFGAGLPPLGYIMRLVALWAAITMGWFFSTQKKCKPHGWDPTQPGKKVCLDYYEKEVWSPKRMGLAFIVTFGVLITVFSWLRKRSIWLTTRENAYPEDFVGTVSQSESMEEVEGMIRARQADWTHECGNPERA